MVTINNKTYDESRVLYQLVLVNKHHVYLQFVYDENEKTFMLTKECEQSISEDDYDAWVEGDYILLSEYQ